jgi:hypothetical protein
MPIVLSDPMGVPVYPQPADVRSGVAYGPSGTEHVGQLPTAAVAPDLLVVEPPSVRSQTNS